MAFYKQLCVKQNYAIIFLFTFGDEWPRRLHFEFQIKFKENIHKAESDSITIMKQASKNVSVVKPDELKLQRPGIRARSSRLTTAHGYQLLVLLSGDKQVYTYNICINNSEVILCAYLCVYLCAWYFQYYNKASKAETLDLCQKTP